MLEYPDDENGAALRHMAEQGVDLTVAHKIEFEHVFPDEKSARQFVKEVGAAAVESQVRAPDAEDPDDEWEVQCSLRLIPSHEGLTAEEQRLDEIASSLGGYSDGWGLISNPDGSPAD